MGVHGNGLTSLVWMKPSPRSTVVEFFYPEGFAHDYEYTSRALGMGHYGFWNDKWVRFCLTSFSTDNVFSFFLQIFHKPRRTARELPKRLPGQRDPNRRRSCGSLMLGAANTVGGSGRLTAPLWISPRI